MVPYSEILEDNGVNMNVPRYIQKIDTSLPQNIAAHLKGGIPKHDIDSLERLWEASPELKDAIFTCADPAHDIYQLALASDEIEGVFEQDKKLQTEKHKEGTEVFDIWRDEVRDILLGITEDTDPKAFIRGLGSMVLEAYVDSLFLDNYDIYLHLLLAPFLRGTFSICILWPRSAVRTFQDDTDSLRLLLLPRGLSLMAFPP